MPRSTPSVSRVSVSSGASLLWVTFRYRLLGRYTLLLLGSCCFHGFNSLGTSTDRQLSTKPKTRTSLPIDAVMGSVGIGDVLIPTDRSYPRGSFIEPLLCFLQSCLMSIYIQLDADCPYERFVHKRSIAGNRTKVKKGGRQGVAHCGAWQFLPCMNARGFLATSL